ncbi:hypothetical protein GTR00_18960 [Kineococcus sp. T90]|nr:hypothetical protein [Kineococcus indalonis]
MTYTPDKGFAGTDSFTYEVQDASGHISAPATVRLVVAPDVTPTLLVDPGSGSLSAGARSGTFPLVVSDPDQPAGGLVLSASSSNTALVPNSSVVFGTGLNGVRTVTITASSGVAGKALVTLKASDGEASRTLGIAVAVGDGGANTLTGTVGSDLLVGAGGADVLSGDAGRDVLVGGDGDDTLTGGTGRDRFAPGAGVNTLKDFSATQDTEQ